MVDLSYLYNLFLILALHNDKILISDIKPYLDEVSKCNYSLGFTPWESLQRYCNAWKQETALFSLNSSKLCYFTNGYMHNFLNSKNNKVSVGKPDLNT